VWGRGLTAAGCVQKRGTRNACRSVHARTSAAAAVPEMKEFTARSTDRRCVHRRAICGRCWAASAGALLEPPRVPPARTSGQGSAHMRALSRFQNSGGAFRVAKWPVLRLPPHSSPNRPLSSTLHTGSVGVSVRRRHRRLTYASIAARALYQQDRQTERKAAGGHHYWQPKHMCKRSHTDAQGCRLQARVACSQHMQLAM
jgi:hypothetical protein